MGLSQLTDGKPAFINFTRDLLVNGYATLLPQDLVVIELLEAIRPDPEVMTACRQLKKDGYAFALDDMHSLDDFEPFADLVDIVKVDFQRLDPDQRRRFVEVCQPRGVTMLAEKVETHEERDEAIAAGYSLLQGYYFAKPQILSARRAPTREATDLLLIQEAFRSELDIERLELVIKQDPTFSLKLLRYVNSAFFGLRTRIRSIRQALVMLGEKRLKRWVVVLVATGFSEQKPALLTQTVVRARFAENLAGLFGQQKNADEIFLTGLFSLLHAIMDQTQEEILASVSVGPEIEAAIKGEESPYGSLLALAKAYEKGNWDRLAEILASRQIDESALPPLYEEAVQWSQELVSMAEPEPTLTTSRAR